MPIGDQTQRFIDAFDYIVSKCDNDPSALRDVANKNLKVKEAAEVLNELTLFAGFEDDSKEKFARNVSKSFLMRWADFKDKWENECLKFDWLIGGLTSSSVDTSKKKGTMTVGTFRILKLRRVRAISPMPFHLFPIN